MVFAVDQAAVDDVPAAPARRRIELQRGILCNCLWIIGTRLDHAVIQDGLAVQICDDNTAHVTRDCGPIADRHRRGQSSLDLKAIAKTALNQTGRLRAIHADEGDGAVTEEADRIGPAFDEA